MNDGFFLPTRHHRVLRWPFTFVVLLVLGFPVVYGQAEEPRIQFGIIALGDRQLERSEIDTTADAMVLYDQMYLHMVEDEDGTYYLLEDFHRQVKLFRESSFDRADVELVFFPDGERIKDLKAVVHSPEGGVQHLEQEDFIREKYDDDRGIWKFTFPNVSEGAVIEYSYTKKTKYITIPDRYYFQEDIPVRWAEFKASIPGNFSYVTLSNASNHAVDEVTVEKKNFGNVQVKHQNIRWAFKDLRPYKEQAYVNNLMDYVPQVRLQLQSYQRPGAFRKEIFSNWEKAASDLNGWLSFGKAYRGKANYGKVWSVVAPKLEGLKTEMEKAEVLYNFVANGISWNGRYTWSSEDTPNRVYASGRGSSGEISMVLLALLREAGIDAQPVLVPLRNKGMPVEQYPLLRQFGHLMVVATLGGEETFLDPNEVSRPIGLPRVSALNHRVFIADPKNPHWVDVKAPRAVQTVMADVVLDESGMGYVQIRSRLNSYYAFEGRKKINNLESIRELPLADMIVKSFPETEIIGYETPGDDKLSDKLTLNLELKVPMGQPIDDYLYVKPILCPALEQELVDVEKRVYPIDFAYPRVERYITSISIPEGYVVEELPPSMKLTSEDGTISCTIATEDKGNQMISLNFSVSINRTVFQPREYIVLQDMFQRVIELQESIIILKKTQ
jgi:transglutaminase-like putative cysteine protease